MEKELLNYETHEEGDPVLFLHGFGASNYTWSKIYPLISGKKLILLELKGYGKSEKPMDGKYSVHDQAELVCNFIADHDLKNLVLVGHSFGGGVALVVALKLQSQGQGLRGLILIDSAGYRQKFPFFMEVLRLPVIGGLASLLPSKLRVRTVLEDAYFDNKKITEETVRAYAEPLRLAGASHALRQTVFCLPPSDIDDLEKSYPTIRAPALLIWGREDKIIPLELGERLNQAIQGSKLIVFERCGHMPPEEWPDKTGEEINKFLNRA